MNRRQAGVSLIGLIVILVILAVVALFGMKVIPSYLEFRAARNSIIAIAATRPATKQDVIRAFENRALIDGVETIKGTDLTIEKGSISFAYRKEVPLFTNVALCIDYAASAATQQ